MTRALRRIALLGAALVAAAGSVRAQGNFNATIVVPGLPSPFISEWERNPQLATVIVNYTGSAPTSYFIGVEIKGATRGVISKATSGPYEIPLGPATQLIASTQLNCFTAENVQAIVDQMVRTGVIPEDRYTITVRLVARGGAELARASQVFTISLPDPPRLIYPPNEGSVMTTQPLFQWTPVIVPPEMGIGYRLRVVEVLPQQTADVALTSNRPWHEDVVSGAATLLYPLDALALEEGKRYAWRVEAIDGSGNPITSARRRSESFAFMRDSISASLPVSGTVPDTAMVSQVARLTGLRRATVTDGGGRFTFGGRAQLDIMSYRGGTVNVGLSAIAVDKASLPDATVSGGSFSGDFASPIPVGSFAALTGVTFTAGGNVKARGQLMLPGMPAIPLGGDVEYTVEGPLGTLVADANALRAARVIGGDPVGIQLTEARVSLPSGWLELTGTVTLFGATACTGVPITADSAGHLSAPVSCAPSVPIPLVRGARAPTLEFIRADGTIEGELATATLAPTLALVANLMIDSTCGGTIELTTESSGVRATRLVENCGGAPASYGWLQLALSGLSMQRLQYAPGQGWNFGFTVDAQPSVPAFATLPLPAWTGVQLAPNGWTFGELDAPLANDPLAVEGWEFRATRVRSARFTRAWTAPDTGGLSFALTGGLTLLRPGPAAPACLATPMPATATLAARLTITPDDRALGNNCTIAIGGGGVQLLKVTGSLVAALQPQLQVERRPEARGALVLPPSFDCASAAQRAHSLGEAPLALDSAGRVRGRVTQLAIGCPASLGAFAIVLFNATLDFDAGDGTSGGVGTLAGTASASFGPGARPVTGSGSATIDLATGAFRDGRVTFAGPFPLGIPVSNPTLQFTVPGAVLDTAGLHIEGAGSLDVPAGSAVDVTFAQLALNTTTFNVSGGSATFGAPFALRTDIDTAGTLRWTAAPAGATTSSLNSARIDLPAGSALTVAGIGVSGSAPAALAWRGISLSAIGASYSDSVMFGVSPFGVARGTINLEQTTQRLAYIDPSGFHADAIGRVSGAMPTRVLLPAVEVGYLDLSRSDTSSVKYERRSDGTHRLTSAPGRTLPLVLPALTGAAPTRFNATVDLVLDATGAALVSGRVTSAATPAIDFTSRGLPFVVDSFTFNALPGGGDWTVAGRPIALGATRGANGAVKLALDNAGRLSGPVHVAASTFVEMIGGKRRLGFALDSVSGALSFAPNAGGGTYTLAAVGALRLDAGGTQPLSVVGSVVTTERGTSMQVDPGASSATTQPSTLGPFSIALANARVSRLDRGAAGWNTELLLDLSVGLTALPSLPAISIPDVALDRAGLHLPAINEPNLRAQGQNVSGYRLTPLALRAPAGVIDWFNETVPSALKVGVDVELAFPNASGPLKSVHLTALDAEARNGYFVGKLEPLTLSVPADVLLGTDGAAIRVLSLAGQLDQKPSVTASASLVVPTAMRCQASTSGMVALPANALTLSELGALGGSVANLGPPCPMRWGPMALRVSAATLTVLGTADAPRAELNGTGALAFADAAGDTVRAGGALKVDVATMRPVGSSLAIASPFRWNATTGVTGVVFGVRRATFGAAGLVFDGAGALRNARDSVAAVAFQSLTYAFPDFAIGTGSANLTTPAALNSAIAGNGKLNFALERPTTWQGTTDRLQLMLAAGATIDGTGITPGPAGAKLAYDSRDLGSIAAAATGGFKFSTALRVSAGRTDLTQNADSLGYVDVNGFSPGPAFTSPQIPARLLLPSDSVAYIALRDGAGAPLVEALRIVGSSSVNIRALAGRTLQLVVPALRVNGQPATFPVTLDNIQANARTAQVTSGTIDVAVTGIDGGPMEIARLTYANPGGGYALRASGRVKLPASLAMNIPIEVPVTARGLDGTVARGQMAPSTAAVNIASANVGTSLTVNLLGFQGTFGAANEVKLGGTFLTPVFATGSSASATRTPIAWTATITGTTSTFAATMPSSGTLPMLATTFTPAATQGLAVVATAQEFALRADGVWRVPQLGTGFAITLTDLRTGTRGVTLPVGAIDQSFQMFGTSWIGRPVAFGSANTTAGLQGNLLRFVINGRVTLFGRPGDFQGLNVSTEGAIGTGNILSDSIRVGGGKLVIPSLAFPGGRMVARVGLRLPDPIKLSVDTAIVVGVDGKIERSRLILRDEISGLGPGKTVSGVPGLTVHARRIELNVAALDGASSGVQVVGDAYLFGSAKNGVKIGTDFGGVIKPGYTLGFDGKASWQNFDLGDTVFVNLKKLAQLEFQAVTAPTGEEFEAGLTGRFAVNVGEVQNKARGKVATRTNPSTSKGIGLTYRDLYLTKNGPSFSRMVIDGGTLALMNGALVVDVGRIRYADSATTVKITAPPPSEPGAMQSGGAPPEIDVAVNSLLDLGGSICIGEPGNTVLAATERKCTFSGGVERLLMYEEASTGLVSFSITNAKVSLQNRFDLTLDFAYTEIAGGGEGIAFGGTGTVKPSGKQLIVAGAVETGSVFRVGAFLAIPVELPIGPVKITQVGGGFFWNPRPEHIQLIRTTAFKGFSAPPTKPVTVEGAQFALFLYGEAAVINERVAKGRVLLTGTDQQFLMDGAVVIADQGDKISGVLSVVVGFKRGYVEGNIDIQALEPGIVRSTANIMFFAYSSSTWGIYGSGKHELFPIPVGKGFTSVMVATGDFFIGPRGFLVGMAVNYQISLVKIISASAGWQARVWYHQPSSSWGAYGAIYASISILGIGVDGTLEGALVGEGGTSATFYFAGEVGVSIPLIGRQSFSVWASIGSGGFDGGLGRDAGMDAALAKARLVRDQLEASKNQVQAAITQAQAAANAPRLSREQLLAVYGGMKAMLQTGGANDVTSLIATERQTYANLVGIDGKSTLKKYLDWYEPIIRGDGAPVADTSKITTLRATAETNWIEAQRRQSAVEPKVRAISANIVQANELALPGKPGDPVRNAAFGAPVATVALDSDGMETKTMSSGPGFDFDAATATDAKTYANAAKAAVAANAARVMAAAKGMDSALARVKDATSASSGSLLGALESFGAARLATEQLFATRLEQLGTAVLWARGRKSDFLAHQFEREQIVGAIWGDFRLALIDEKEGWAARLIKHPTPAIVDQRVELIKKLAAADTFSDKYYAERPKIVERSYANQRPYPGDHNTWSRWMGSTFYYLYFSAGYTGLEESEKKLMTKIDTARAEMQAKLGPIRAAHVRLTAATDSIFAQQAALGGVVYDLYDRYLVLSPAGAEKTLAERRRTQLTTDLKTPAMQPVNVTVSTSGWTSTVTATWSGTHPSGTTEHLYNDGSGLYSNGARGSVAMVRSYLETDKAPLTQSDTFSASVRGGLGFRTNQSVKYSITYPAAAQSSGSPAPPVVTTTRDSAATDRTKPSKPNVTFDDTGINTGGAYQLAWVQPSSRIRTRWTSTDDESGIREYSLAVGTTPGGTDVTPWTVMGGRTDKILEELNAATGGMMYVSVRSKNGAGLESDVGTSAALRIDPTPPVFPASSLTMHPINTTGTGDIEYVAGACTASGLPSRGTYTFGGSPPLGSGYTSDTRWVKIGPAPSEDLSGVRAVYGRIGALPFTSFEDPGSWTLIDVNSGGYQAKGPALAYPKEAYATIAVVNYAGGVTLRSIGPFTAPDPGGPRSPIFCASPGQTAGSLSLRFGSIEPEEKARTKGYQYRIVDARNGTVVRDYPANGAVDWADIPSSSWKNVGSNLAGGVWHADVRGVSKGGTIGYAMRSTIYTDITPPPAPVLTLSAYANKTGSSPRHGGIITDMKFSADAESGLLRAELAIGTSPSDPSSAWDWKALVDHAPGKEYYGVGFNWSYIWGTRYPNYIPTPLPPGRYYVTLRVINGAGQSTTVGGYISMPPDQRYP